MKQTIKNPHKVPHIKYILLIILFFATLSISLAITGCEKQFWVVFSDVIKNLSYGCVASTLVAWFIDCASVRSMNKKANGLYEAVYLDLKFQIAKFISSWSELCAVAFKDEDYYEEKKTWTEWYKVSKENFCKLDPDRQVELFIFFHSEIEYIEKKVSESIEEIYKQKYLLTINDLLNNKLKSILTDFKFEFYALHLDLSHKDDIKRFWEHMDAITSDLEKYINNWEDISYYNKILWKPYDLDENSIETYKAMLIHNGCSESKMNKIFGKLNCKKRPDSL
ncbi:MAG: hypothetical protein IJ015_06660 [Ruminococcus sp.]|nr:hypothetical protein [Ruminococcus sp.]